MRWINGQRIDPPTPRRGARTAQNEYKPEVIVSTSSHPPFGGIEGGCVCICLR